MYLLKREREKESGGWNEEMEEREKGGRGAGEEQKEGERQGYKGNDLMSF